MKRFLSCGHERDLLLTELAHDLRNLLSSILGGLNLLHTSLQSDKTKRRPCHAARQNPCCRRQIRRSPDRQGVWREQNDDWGQLSEEAFLHDFAGDLPPEEARVLYAVQQPFKKSLTTGKTTNAAWRAKPTFYAVSTQDRTINLGRQKAKSAR